MGELHGGGGVLAVRELPAPHHAQRLLALAPGHLGPAHEALGVQPHAAQQPQPRGARGVAVEPLLIRGVDAYDPVGAGHEGPLDGTEGQVREMVPVPVQAVAEVHHRHAHPGGAHQHGRGRGVGDDHVDALVPHPFAQLGPCAPVACGGLAGDRGQHRGAIEGLREGAGRGLDDRALLAPPLGDLEEEGIQRRAHGGEQADHRRIPSSAGRQLRLGVDRPHLRRPLLRRALRRGMLPRRLPRRRCCGDIRPRPGGPGLCMSRHVGAPSRRGSLSVDPRRDQLDVRFVHLMALLL